MATRLYIRNAICLAKIETTEGTDSSPTAALNAVLASELSVEPLAGSTVDLAYVRPYFGVSPNMRVEDYVTISLTCDMAGTATAGTAAPWGPLLRACGMAETLTASAVTGTAQASSTTSITLAAGASSTDGTYVGADITMAGQTRTIIAYNGTTKVATVHKVYASAPTVGSYTIGANAIYLPVSTGFESITIYYNVNGVQHKATGCRGTVSFTLDSNQRPIMKYQFTGIYNAVTDTAVSGSVFTSWQVPVPVNSSNSEVLLAGKASDGSATGIQVDKFSLDLGTSVKHRMLIGSENVVLTDRQAKGQVSIEATTVTFNDWWSQIRAATKFPMLIENGTAAGNTVGIFMPSSQLIDPKYSDVDGVAELDMGFLAIPSVGNDEVRVCVK